MNPFTLVPLFVYSLAATLWPAQIDGHRRGRELLLLEIVFVAAAIGAGMLLDNLVVPRAAGLWWGRAGLFATAYLYVCGRGIVVVRAVLELPALQMRRDEDRNAGAVDIARGRTIGVLRSGSGNRSLRVDLHDLAKQLKGSIPGALEGVAAHDRAKAAAVADGAGLVQQGAVLLPGAT